MQHGPRFAHHSLTLLLPPSTVEVYAIVAWAGTDLEIWPVHAETSSRYRGRIHLPDMALVDAGHVPPKAHIIQEIDSALPYSYSPVEG